MKDGEEKSEVTKIDHVDVGVDFSAAVFEKAADALEVGENGGGITCKRGIGGGGKASADARGVLVKDEDGEDIAEEHANEDESDTAENEEATRT